ncbi:hypothetical protein GOBAR_DD26054 [Gossypium barbadense]|nr:hypothetical protein GOBAR_DD26054 [Gossypium barbadense]
MGLFEVINNGFFIENARLVLPLQGWMYLILWKCFYRTGRSIPHEELNGEAAKFYALLNDMNKELYEGSKFSKMSLECPPSTSSSRMDVSYPGTNYHQSVRGDDMEGMLRDTFNMHNHGLQSFPANFMASDDCTVSGNAFIEPGEVYLMKS